MPRASEDVDVLCKFCGGRLASPSSSMVQASRELARVVYTSSLSGSWVAVLTRGTCVGTSVTCRAYQSILMARNTGSVRTAVRPLFPRSPFVTPTGMS